MGERPAWRFGGGFDLTPYYRCWRTCATGTGARGGVAVWQCPHAEFKEACDRYFFKHRNETRGVGGLFSD
ncbi:MAG: coproporphyrinogen III oxidase [Xanthomonadales bacterium]|nr:coproporphyrinogen III oxidase [Xanthomonadales bacterium]